MTEFLMARSATIIPDLGSLIRKLTGSGIGSASEFINELSKFINIFSTIYCICAVLVLCYFGYCAFRTILAIQGFIGGAGVGAVLGLVIAIKNGEFESIGDFAIMGALIVGVIGCVLANLLYKLGVFMFFSSSTFIVMLLLVGLGSGGDWSSAMTAGAIVGFIVGIVAVAVDKYFIIAGTATVGAFTGGAMIMYSNAAFGVIVTVLLLVSGILVQVKLTQKLADGIKVGKKNKNPSVQYQAPAVKAPIVCPSCGTLNPDPGMFCMNCSSKLPRPVASAPATSAQSTRPERIPAAPMGAVCTCVNCGHTNPAGLVFCAKCGYRLEKAPTTSALATASKAPTSSQKPSLLERLSENNDSAATKNLRRCPNCGAMVTAFSKTCEKCYEPFDDEDENTPAPVFQAAPDFGTQAYPGFGAAPMNNAPVYNAPDYSTAPVSSPVAALRCQACGNPGEPGERFCSACGRPFN